MQDNQRRGYEGVLLWYQLSLGRFYIFNGKCDIYLSILSYIWGLCEILQYVWIGITKTLWSWKMGKFRIISHTGILICMYIWIVNQWDMSGNIPSCHILTRCYQCILSLNMISCSCCYYSYRLNLLSLLVFWLGIFHPSWFPDLLTIAYCSIYR